MMYKLSIAIVAVALAGCASTNTWRDLEIDGSNPTSINESVATIQQELSERRRERFDMVLADLWITRQLAAEAAGGSYTEGEYRAQLDGLRYQDVLDLAGPDTTPRYWAIIRTRGQSSANSSSAAWSGTDPNRFPSYGGGPTPGMISNQVQQAGFN